MASGPDENGRERIVQASKPADEAEITAGEQALEDRAADLASQPEETDVPGTKDLRPRRFQDYVGQRAVVDSISIAVMASKKRGDTLDHALFHGPPGLGKTTIA
ncbi:MAG: hypothetical protein V3T49_05465, partial [Dehalococcoidia bacterium]